MDKEIKTEKEVFTEPTCELVQFNFEDVLATDLSPDAPIVLPEDEF